MNGLIIFWVLFVRNEKVGKLEVSFKLVLVQDTMLMLFKNNQKENSCNADANCGDYPYSTPVKKLISSKVEALVL